MKIVSFFIGVRGKIRRSFSERGIAGTLLYIPKFSASRLKSSLSSRRRREKLDELRSQQQFDREFKVDTAGIVLLTDMKVIGPNLDHGHYYAGTDPKVFQRVMQQLPINHADFTFIDYGSGKGKALLLASLWNFMAVVGVEFAKTLHEIALLNCENFVHPDKKCQNIQPLHIDATQFDLPLTPLLLYFYNPLSEAEMLAVLKKIEMSLIYYPRDVWICYTYLYSNAPLDKASFLNLIVKNDDYRIYRTALS